VCTFYIMNSSTDFHEIRRESFVQTKNFPCGVAFFLAEKEVFLLCSILIQIVMILVQQSVWSTKTR
jgi:hypothetical protein